MMDDTRTTPRTAWNISIGAIPALIIGLAAGYWWGNSASYQRGWDAHAAAVAQEDHKRESRGVEGWNTYVLCRNNGGTWITETGKCVK